MSKYKIDDAGGKHTDLTAGPINTFYLHRLTILDGLSEWNIWVPSIVKFGLVFCRLFK